MGRLRDDSVMSLDFAEFAVAILQSVQAGEWETAIAGVRLDTPSFVGVAKYPATDTTPQMLIGYQRDFAAVFIAGASRLALAQGFYGGFPAYNPFPIPAGVNEVNSFTEAIADFVEGELTALGVAVDADRVTIGHSLGGTVAHSLVRRVAVRFRDTRAGFCTFGAPKYFQHRIAPSYAPRYGIRYFNTDDPVPLFPFSALDTPLAAILAPPQLLNGFAQEVQPLGGVEIFDDGKMSPGSLPANAIVTQLFGFALWFYGADTAAGTAHSIPEYRRRIGVAVSNAQQPKSAQRVSVEQPAPPTSTNRLVNQQEARVATVVSNAQAAQTAIPVSLPPPRLFSVVRQGKIYLIAFGDQAIAMSSVKGTARSLCRQLNTAFRHLQRLAFVDPANFVQQLQSYLQAAATPGSGFQPLMNTTLPTP